MRIRSFISGLVCIVLIQTSALSDGWQKLEGPYGGVVNDLMTVGDTVFAIIFGGVFRSVDCGETWMSLRLAKEFADFDFTAIGRISNGNFFVGTSRGKIFRSEDGGPIWTEVTGLPSGEPVSSIIGNAEGTLFAGAINGAFRSTDFGETWEDISIGVGVTTMDLAYDLSGDIYAATPDGFFRSTDDGSTWLERNGGLTDTDVTSISIDTDGDVFAGTGGGSVFRSSNGGDVWTNVTNGISENRTYDVTTRGSDEVFVGTPEGGMYSSTDNGESWTSSREGLPAGVTVMGAIAVKQDALFVGLQPGGVYRTMTTTWEESNTGLAATKVTAVTVSETGDRVYGAHEVAISWTEDQGATWNDISVGVPASSPTDLAPLSGGGVVATYAPDLTQSIDGHVFRSQIGADSTIDITPSQGLFWNGVAVNPSSNTIIVACDLGLQRTTDLGTTWALSNTGLPSGNALDIEFNAFNITWNVLVQNGIYESTDDGQSWQFYAPAFALFNERITTSPTTGQVAVIDGAAGLVNLCSPGSCLPLTNGWPFGLIPRDIHFRPDGNLLASTIDGPVFGYDTTLSQWADLSEGLEGYAVEAFGSQQGTGSLHGTDIIYAGTLGGGMFALGLPTSVSDTERELPAYFDLVQNYPNPFNPTTTIRYGLPHSSYLRLEVFNVLGERIRILHEGPQDAGYHSIVFEAKGLPSGTYFYRLQAEGFVETKKLMLLK